MVAWPCFWNPSLRCARSQDQRKVKKEMTSFSFQYYEALGKERILCKEKLKIASQLKKKIETLRPGWCLSFWTEQVTNKTFSKDER